MGVPKAGTAAITYIGPAAIGGALAGLSGWAGAGVGAAIGLLTYELATFCPGGPPAQSSWTAQDVADLLNPVTTPEKIAANQKFQDFLGAVFWPILCQCSGGAVTAPAPSTYPSGGLQTVLIAPPNAPCKTVSTAAHTFTTGSSLLVGGNNYGYRNVTSVVMTMDTFNHTGTGNTFDFKFDWDDAGSPTVNIIRTDHVSLGSTQHKVQTFVPPPGALEVVLTISTLTGTGSSDATCTIDVYCDGQVPGGTSQPCCPPDPALQAEIDAILQAVTLIQRQMVPFAYVATAVHAGLSGAGSLSIQGLLGIKVAITTLPASLGSAGTSPTELFDAGWLTFGTPDGYPQSVRLERSAQVVLPARCSAFTALAYDLHPGVVVTITELVREP